METKPEYICPCCLGLVTRTQSEKETIFRCETCKLERIDKGPCEGCTEPIGVLNASVSPSGKFEVSCGKLKCATVQLFDTWGEAFRAVNHIRFLRHEEIPFLNEGGSQEYD